MKNLGYLSDCILHLQLGEVVKKERYWLIRNRDNPTYRWGNLLVYPKAPTDSDGVIWLKDFRHEFGVENEHVTLGWESDSIGHVEMFRKWGFNYEPLSVLKRTRPTHPLTFETSQVEGIELRKIESEKDWDQVLKLQFQVAMETSSDPMLAYQEFLIRKYTNYRRVSDRGRGLWFGAFDEDRLVGDMGLFWDLDQKLARFQNVETAWSYRRKGICSSLLQYVLKTSSLMCGLQTWIIVAELGSLAEQLYQRQGFQRVGMQQGVCLPHRFEYALFI